MHHQLVSGNNSLIHSVSLMPIIYLQMHLISHMSHYHCLSQAHYALCVHQLYPAISLLASFHKFFFPVIDSCSPQHWLPEQELERAFSANPSSPTGLHARWAIYSSAVYTSTHM